MELSSQTREGLRATMEDILAAGAERHLLDDATIAASLDQAKAFWLVRHHIADTQKYEGGSIKHDVSVPVNAVPDFIVEATAAVGLPSAAPPYAYSTLIPASATSRSAGASDPGPFGTVTTMTSRSVT